MADATSQVRMVLNNNTRRCHFVTGGVRYRDALRNRSGTSGHSRAGPPRRFRFCFTLERLRLQRDAMDGEVLRRTDELRTALIKRRLARPAQGPGLDYRVGGKPSQWRKRSG